MNRRPIYQSSSIWFASLVALLAALGAQVLLESIIPANFAEVLLGKVANSNTVQHVTADSLWYIGTVIHFLSYAIGGLIAVILVGSLTRRLAGILLAVAILATVFEQFPNRDNLLLIFWSLSAPAGILIGAWLASAKPHGP